MPHRVAPDRAEQILSTLSEWQFLRPHRPLREVIADAVTTLGVCPQAAAGAVAWLDVDDTRPVGRLRATELIQLARCIGRLWDQGAAAPL